MIEESGQGKKDTNARSGRETASGMKERTVGAERTREKNGKRENRSTVGSSAEYRHAR